MYVRALFPLLLPLLCMAHNVHYRSPPPSCPDDVCVCSVSEVPTGRFQQQQRQAICKEIPTQRLTKTITSLRVNGQITKVTKKMIANLGGELLSLDLSDCEIQSIETGSFDAAPKLIKLKLSNNQIEEIGPGMFKKNKVLRELYLDGNRLKQIDETAFAKLEQLRELHVEKNYLTQFPSKIPIGLTVLNVSQNNLGPNFTCDIRETNLKDLDLCGNHLEQIENSTLHALNKLQHLCIGDKAVHFPKNTAVYLPHLAELSLVASTLSHAVLDSTTQTALGDMETLTSLSIVNYKIESLSFLHSLTKLRYLTLQDITTTHVVDFQSLMLSKTSLIDLNLEESYNLAHMLLDNMQVLGTLTSLQKISFRKTNITHVAAFDVPHTNHTQLDISNNPLLCDCGFAWLRNEGQNQSAHHIIVNSEETVCAAPSEHAGRKLMDVIQNLDCPSESNHGTRGSHPLNRRFSNREPNTRQLTTTPGPNENNNHHWPISQGSGYHRPMTPVKFPKEGDSEIFTHTNHEQEKEHPSHPNWNNGRPVKFPTHPPKGGESEFPTDPNQEGESELPTNPNQEEESESPTHPSQEEESELPTGPNQGGKPDIPWNTDIPDTKTTVEPLSTVNEFEEKHTEQGQSVPPTSESSHGMPQHMLIYDGDDDENDASGIVYIILGTLLGLLILVGLVLSIFYWKFKMTGSNKINPESSMPGTGTIAGIPTEPTFQQLQHNEGSSLLKNVKK